MAVKIRLKRMGKKKAHQEMVDLLKKSEHMIQTEILAYLISTKKQLRNGYQTELSLQKQ